MIPRILTAASLAVLMGTACGPSQPDSQPASSTLENGQESGGDESSQPVAGPGDEANNVIARQAPAFAGLYFENGTLVVATVDLSDEAKAQLLAAVQPLLTERGIPPEQVVFRQVEYSWDQLFAWRWVMRNTSLAAPSFSFLDADEFRNRVVVGVADAAHLEAARQYGESHGVPREALVVQVSPPIQRLPGGR